MSDKTLDIAWQLEQERQQAAELRKQLSERDGWLAECYRLSGADPDGNEDWRLAPHAVEEVRRLRKESDEDQAKLSERDAEMKRLKLDLDVAQSVAHTLAHPIKSPFCEHSSAYSHSEDGGKTIRCLLCAESSLKAKLGAVERELEAERTESKQIREEVQAVCNSMEDPVTARIGRAIGTSYSTVEMWARLLRSSIDAARKEGAEG